jgi:hypothetical protein
MLIFVVGDDFGRWRRFFGLTKLAYACENKVENVWLSQKIVSIVQNRLRVFWFRCLIHCRQYQHFAGSGSAVTSFIFCYPDILILRKLIINGVLEDDFGRWRRFFGLTKLAYACKNNVENVWLSQKIVSTVQNRLHICDAGSVVTDTPHG